MWVGHAITGNAAMVYDLLFSPAFHERSILVVGEPGSGKTTIVREIAQVLAEEQNDGDMGPTTASALLGV